ncbi:hypothetical protein CAC42_5193 [Sphaceloma murrayae]|uniref:Uncharacterized protein n=1 Tax=Sphaceloma murrayae TaxID=2082308 RepID=A0A2K1QUA7_9PEZI|nr:hypothetical protein CAC42_5193 [Sphaceloma murrayae]
MDQVWPRARPETRESGYAQGQETLDFELSWSIVASGADVVAVKAAVTNPQVFCQFYISKTQKTTPFSALGVARTTTACQCIRQSGGKLTITTPTPRTCATAKCSTDDIATIKKEFKKPLVFCKFFTALKGRTLRTNPHAASYDSSMSSYNQGSSCIHRYIIDDITDDNIINDISIIDEIISDIIDGVVDNVLYDDDKQCNLSTSESPGTTDLARSTNVVGTLSPTPKAKSSFTLSTPSLKPTTATRRTTKAVSMTTTTTTTVDTTEEETSTTESTQTTQPPSTTTEESNAEETSVDDDDDSNLAGRLRGAKTTTTTTTTSRTTTTTTTTTTTLPFCSSTAIKSLMSDSSATPFCWSALSVPTATFTVRSISTTTATLTVTNTNVAYTTSFTTQQITRLPNATETFFVTNFATCGGGNTFAKRDAQAAQTSSPGTTATPSYLRSLSPAAVTSACKCLTALPIPTITKTVVFNGPIVTVTSRTDLNVVSTVIKTITSINYSNASSVPTVTATTTITSTATAPGGAVVTNALAPKVPGVFVKYPGYSPGDDVPGLLSCQCSVAMGGTCDFTDYGTTTIPASTCTDFNSCISSCAYLNTRVTTNKCTGVYFDGDVGFCTLLGPSYLPMVDTSACGVFSGNASSNSGFAALIRSS